MNSIDFISELVKGIGNVLDADLTFVSRAVDMPVTRARGIVGYKNGVAQEPWEFDLKDNPCQLTYEGNPTFIPCDVAIRFAGKKDSGFESFIGVPLFDEDEQVIGHLAIYSSKVQVADDFKFLLLQLCASCATIGVRQSIHEEQLTGDIEHLETHVDMLNEAVLTLTHDLRSPLSAMLNFLSGVSDTKLPFDIENAIRQTKNGAEQLLNLSNEYIDLARLGLAVSDASKTDINIEKMAIDAAKEASILCRDQNIRINIASNGGLPYVTADAPQIKRVFANLLSNAIDYSPNNDVISVWCERHGDFIRVAVMDNGKGVDEAFIENIFEAFVGEGPDFNRAQSIGLGLSIAKAIVERNGGTIRAENKSVGVCFNFDLPIVARR